MAEPENCTHDCSTCSENCGARKNPEDFLEKQNDASDIKKIIGVVSGKGGVGKSLVTSLLAVEMNRKGKSVAVLDADITGPSIPRAFGLNKKAESDGTYLHPVVSDKGIKIMSMNLLLKTNTDPVVWRGPVIAGAVKQFYTDVCWGDVDYMFVDMPPGTGDVPLTVFQSLPIAGIIIVTSPQDLVSMIVEKAVTMAGLMNVPVLGIVENMSYFECPDCGKRHRIFGDEESVNVAKEHQIETVSCLPIEQSLAQACDLGIIEHLDKNYCDEIIEKLLTL